jgi:DTW domain-containing protein YfiP
MKPEVFLTARECCPNCKKTTSTCFCARLKKFESGPVFAILLHPREARRRVGTARIVTQGISNSILIEGMGDEIDQDPKLIRLLEDPQYHPVVLYPGRDARMLAESTFPMGKQLLIFVIDGTWSQAKKMIRTSPRLRSLPQVMFQPVKPSNYRIRQQPGAICLSTVEAVHTIIESLAKSGHSTLPAGRAHDSLLEVFDWMVDTQIGYESAKQTEQIVSGQ